MMNKKSALMIGALIVLGGLVSAIGTVSGDVTGNDSFTNAEQLTPGTYTGNLTTTTDEADYFKFPLAAGQYFTANITITGAGDPGDTVKMTFYGPTQSNLDATSWLHSGVSEKISYTVGQAAADIGTYYLLVEGGNTVSNNYTLKLDVYDQYDAGQFGDAGDVNTAPRAIVPGAVTGWLADKDEADFYNFTVPGGYTILLTLTPATTGTDSLKLTLYKPDKSYLNSTSWLNPGVPGTVRHTTSHATGGNYICLVEAGNNNYTFYLELAAPNDVGSGTDVSGEMTAAYLLPGNGTYNGTIKDDDDGDAYAFNVSAGQIFTLSLTPGTVDPGTMKLTVNKPNKAYLLSTSWTNPGVTASFNYTTNNAGAGQYYIQIAGENAYTFTILLEDQFDAGTMGDAGDELTTARPVELNKWYNGRLADMDEQDAYSFPGLAGMTVSINFTVLTGTDTGKLTLYNTNKNYLTASSWMNPLVQTYINNTLPSTGTYFILVDAGDSTYTFNVSIPPDTVLPEINITTPGESTGFTSPNITVTGTATDNVGVALVQISRDNATWVNATGTGTWSANFTLSDGGNTVTVKAQDAAGNVRFATRRVYLDTTAPTIVIASPVNASTVTQTLVTVTGTATDNMLVSKIELSQNGGATWVIATGTTAWALNLTLVNGNNSIMARVTDTAGNFNLTAITVNVNAVPSDNQIPAVSINSPAHNSKVNSNKMTIKGSASDNVQLKTVEVFVNGVQVTVSGTTSWSASATLRDGKNNITVVVTDGVGLRNTQTISVTYEKKTPGFEGLFLIGALVVGMVLVAGRKKN